MKVALTKRLEREYLALVESVYPNYHGISIKEVNGFLAYHPLFTNYELAARPLTPAINQWINEHRADLLRADIRHVGIMSGSFGFSSINTTSASAQ